MSFLYFQDLKTYIKTELRDPEILSKIAHPDGLEETSLFVAMPKFSIQTKVELKDALSKRPELKEFFSESADYSRMARERVRVDEIFHQVNDFSCSSLNQESFTN